MMEVEKLEEEGDEDYNNTDDGSDHDEDSAAEEMDHEAAAEEADRVFGNF